MNMEIFKVTGPRRDKIAVTACKSIDKLIFESCKRLNLSTDSEYKVCVSICMYVYITKSSRGEGDVGRLCSSVG